MTSTSIAPAPPKDVAERARALREFARDVRTVPILTQTEPDPDAIGSAFAVRALLDRDERSAPIVSLGRSRRPETRRMQELLELQVIEITEPELKAFDHVVAVDMQPSMLCGGDAHLAVVDHHPRQDDFPETDFLDIRPEFGACATMLTQYLRAVGVDVGKRLATALLYGIRTDTALLTRGCTWEDVEAYAWLQERADLALLNKIDRPAYPRDALARIGHAIGNAHLRDELAVLWLGTVRKNRAHLMPELADLSLNIEGVRWVVASGIVEKSLVMNIRHLAETEPGAGALARRIADSTGGSGGGHATMARVELAIEDAPVELEEEGEDGPLDANGERIADWVAGELAGVRGGGEKQAPEGPSGGAPEGASGAALKEASEAAPDRASEAARDRESGPAPEGAAA